MTWFLLWTVLLLAAGVVFFLLGRRLYRQGKALVHEMTAASDRLGQIAAVLSEEAPAAHPGTPPRR